MKFPRLAAAIVTTVTAAIFFSSFAFAQQLPKGVSRVTSVEGITEYRLDNGMRLLVFPDPSKPTITVNITYLAGSRQGGTCEGGLAPLLEDMVFNGTTQHKDIPH